MYNSKAIILGLIVFVGVFTSPFWLNIILMTPKYERPALALPVNQKECIESVEYMRFEHMQLLNTWRDQALREGKREYTSKLNGKTWEINLQNTCMDCHSNKVDFCDKCHDSNSVDPYCWDCHVEPKGIQQ